MKEQVHEIDSKAYIIMSEVTDIFSNKTHLIKQDIDIINVK